MKDNPIPKHYATPEGFDVIDFNKAYGLNFNLGNVIKYVARAGKKDGESKLKDLKKAINYLERELSSMPSNFKDFLKDEDTPVFFCNTEDIHSCNHDIEKPFKHDFKGVEMPFTIEEFEKALSKAKNIDVSNDSGDIKVVAEGREFNFDPKTLNEWLSKEKDCSFKVKEFRDGAFIMTSEEVRRIFNEGINKIDKLIWSDTHIQSHSPEGFFELHDKPFIVKEFKKDLNDIEVNDPEEVKTPFEEDTEFKMTVVPEVELRKAKAFDPEELTRRFKEDVKLSEELADILELTYASTPDEMKFSEECEFVVADKYSSVISKNAKYRGIPVRTMSNSNKVQIKGTKAPATCSDPDCAHSVCDMCGK